METKSAIRTRRIAAAALFALMPAGAWQGRQSSLFEIRIDPATARGLLVYAEPAHYPKQARERNVAGTVRLEVHVDRVGKVWRMRLLGGPPPLAAPALDAVRKYRYRPFAVGGTPAPFASTVEVEFRPPSGGQGADVKR
jgi:TonB family protein